MSLEKLGQYQRHSWDLGPELRKRGNRRLHAVPNQKDRNRRSNVQSLKKVEEEAEDNLMTTTPKRSAAILAIAQPATTANAHTKRRRRIDPRAGRAMQILGHAIEYLTVEFVNLDALISANSEQLDAVRLPMALNRQVYLECPELPSFGERWRALLDLLKPLFFAWRPTKSLLPPEEQKQP